MTPVKLRGMHARQNTARRDPGISLMTHLKYVANAGTCPSAWMTAFMKQVFPKLLKPHAPLSLLDATAASAEEPAKGTVAALSVGDRVTLE